MPDIRYKIRFWNWDDKNGCYDVTEETFTEREAAERCFGSRNTTKDVPCIQLLCEKVASGCIIDETIISEKRQKERVDMPEFEVTITEKLEMTVSVEADSKEEAEELVARAWHNGDYVLDADSFTGVEFSARKCEPPHERQTPEATRER